MKSLVMKTRLLLSSLALAFGALIVGVSLSTASEVHSLESAGNLTQRSLYWDRPIGPDHSLYFVRMINDRVKLETADPVERIYIQLDYAHTRLKQGRVLISDKPHLAATTITKGEKYLINAVAEYRELDEPSETLEEAVRSALVYHHEQLQELVHELPNDLRSPLDQLREENLIIQQTVFE